jgi:hypothetical protein
VRRFRPSVKLLVPRWQKLKQILPKAWKWDKKEGETDIIHCTTISIAKNLMLKTARWEHQR